MDVQVLNDARSDLATRMATLDIPELHRPYDSKAESWISELVELENRYSFSVVLGTLEYYIEKASSPQSVDGLGIAIEFYLDALWEYKTMSELAARERGAEGG